MEGRGYRTLFFLPACLLILASSVASSIPPSHFLGIAPQDEEYFKAEIIACRDGSKSFPKVRLNDGYCDCPDGTDEPGTSACPESKFYCKNTGDTPQFLFSSRVNDQYCDCCDGSDEYDGDISCPNTCLKIGNVANESNKHDLSRKKLKDISVQEKSSTIDLEDLIQKPKELTIIVMVEVVLATCVITFWFFRRCTRFRRRLRIL